MAIKVTKHPVPITEYPAEVAPYVYTSKAEWIAVVHNLEPRPAGSIACFGGEILTPELSTIVRAWTDAGYIQARNDREGKLLHEMCEGCLVPGSQCRGAAPDSGWTGCATREFFENR